MSNNILVITSNPEKDSMTDAVGAAVAIESAETAAWLPQATQNNSSAATITAHKKRFNGAKPPFCIK